jgi:DNA (cytosine-5)-methyltransferase 1
MNDLLGKQAEYILRDGLLVPSHIPVKPSRPVAIDLFAGCGGMSLGLMMAGFEVLAAADWSEMAAMTYAHNLGAYPMKFEFIEKSDEAKMEKALKQAMHVDYEKKQVVNGFIAGGGWRQGHSDVPGVKVFILGDIRKLTGQRILDLVGRKRGEVDLVCGGPPCQGFSTAGKRDVMDPRNSLVFEFARLVLEIFPRQMVMENVPGIVNMLTPEGLPVMDVLCDMLEHGDYGNADMLKKSLLISSGSGAAIKGRHGKKQQDPKEEPEPVDILQQMEMEL